MSADPVGRAVLVGVDVDTMTTLSQETNNVSVALYAAIALELAAARRCEDAMMRRLGVWSMHTGEPECSSGGVSCPAKAVRRRKKRQAPSGL
jgi:hypothetical protein